MKPYVSLALRPVARLSGIALAFRRAWAHARLAAMLRAALHSSVVVLGTPEVHGTRRITLGEHLFLYRDIFLETHGSGSIQVGDHVVISRGVHIVSYAKIEIGPGTMIGEYSSIRDANHHIDGLDSIRDAGHESEPIRIGAEVWIGRGVAILGGVTIGDHAVIGANAVVTRDIPAGALAVGVPARAVPYLTK